MLHPSENSYHGRTSINQEYWHERIRQTNISTLDKIEVRKKPALLGFCSDTGVQRNQGRIGAKNGPDAIRQALGPLAYHTRFDYIQDFGNCWDYDGNLEEGHDELYGHIHSLLAHNYFPVIFGGGHDLAYPHGKAVMDYCLAKNDKVGIINLDAHLDLRDLANGQRHSGSPFFQLAEAYGKDFHYCCLGMQPASNPKSLLSYAEKINACIVDSSDFQQENWQGIQDQLEHFCADKNKLYLSIDLDGFSSAYAPGVSAPSPLGFSPILAMKVIDWLMASKKMIAMDIVELNPLFDQDNCTAKLAARLVEYTIRKM